MASRLKEDEKNERIIRSLLKLPANRRCINCNSLGPQYVCTNFWIFVCTTCSGIHREFTHRVKSVSMAKFTSQEVSSLQAGGNERAKEIFFKEWDSQRNSTPDSSNVDKLRDFIKHVYEDRRFTGERSLPQKPKTGDRDDSYENRKVDSYRGGSRSPPYEDDHRYNERPSPARSSDDKNSRYSHEDRRSPGYDRDNQQYGDYGRSPVRPDIVNDWRREDRFGNGRRSEDSKVEGRSPDRQKDLGMSSPPVVRPVREILGENVIPLRIIEPPKAARTQRTTSSSSLGSSNGNPVEDKRENSLIDFDAEPEPPVTAAAAAPPPQTQSATVGQFMAQPTASSVDSNWASFDSSPVVKPSQPSSNVNSLDSVLSQLSAQSSAPVGPTSGLPSTGGTAVPPQGQVPVSFFGGGSLATAPVSNLVAYPHGGAPVAAPGLASGQWPNMQHQQHSFFPIAGTQYPAQQLTPPVGGASNQPWNASLAPSTQGPLNVPPAQPYQAVSTSNHIPSGVVPQPSAAPVEVQSGGRKALPEDLFAATYMPAAVPYPGMHAGLHRGMGYTMQYGAAMPMPTFQQSSRSVNPFDVGNDSALVHAPTFPSMTSLQGALPTIQPSTVILRTSSLGAPPSSAWMQPPSSSYHPSAMRPAPPSYAAALPPSAYMGQHVATNMPPSGYLGGAVTGGFGNEWGGFGPTNPPQQMGGAYSAPTTPDKLSSTQGNPFG